MRKTIAFAFTLISLVFFSLPAATTAQPAPITVFQYSAKFVCGKGDDVSVLSGRYLTVINVHNPSPTRELKYRKKFAMALPDEKPGSISKFVYGHLKADEAMGIDCKNIATHSGVGGSFFEGYAVIQSRVELDVVAVYTAGGDRVESLHTERVPARRVSILTW